MLINRSLEPNSAVCKEMVKLIKTCSDGYPSIQQTLQLQHFVPLFSFLAGETRKDLSVYLLEMVIKKEARLDSTDHVRPAISG